MNLRWFHALLILLSAALATLFGVWCLGQYSRQDGVAPLIAAVAAFAVSGGLVAYDSWFLPVLGFFILPWTTLAYAAFWEWGPGHDVTTIEWFFVVVAFLFFAWLVPPRTQPSWVANAKSKVVLQSTGDWLISMLPDDPESTILKRLKRPKPEDDTPDSNPDQRSELLTQPRASVR